MYAKFTGKHLRWSLLLANLLVTLIRLDFLKVVFTGGGGQFDPPCPLPLQEAEDFKKN